MTITDISDGGWETAIFQDFEGWTLQIDGVDYHLVKAGHHFQWTVRRYVDDEVVGPELEINVENSSVGVY